MAWFATARLVVYLKRISESQARIAQALETLARIEQDQWETEHAPRPKGKFVIGRLDQTAANKRWRQMNEIPLDEEA